MVPGNTHTHTHTHAQHYHSARVIIFAARGWRLRAPDNSVRKTQCLSTCTVPRNGEGANEIGGGIGVGGGNGDGNGSGDGSGDVNGDGDGDGAETGIKVEANEGA